MLALRAPLGAQPEVLEGVVRPMRQGEDAGMDRNVKNDWGVSMPTGGRRVSYFSVDRASDSFKEPDGRMKESTMRRLLAFDLTKKQVDKMVELMREQHPEKIVWDQQDWVI